MTQWLVLVQTLGVWHQVVFCIVKHGTVCWNLFGQWWLQSHLDNEASINLLEEQRELNTDQMCDLKTRCQVHKNRFYRLTVKTQLYNWLKKKKQQIYDKNLKEYPGPKQSLATQLMWRWQARADLDRKRALHSLPWRNNCVCLIFQVPLLHVCEHKDSYASYVCLSEAGLIHLIWLSSVISIFLQMTSPHYSLWLKKNPIVSLWCYIFLIHSCYWTPRLWPVLQEMQVSL